MEAGIEETKSVVTIKGTGRSVITMFPLVIDVELSFFKFFFFLVLLNVRFYSFEEPYHQTFDSQTGWNINLDDF